ncbi:MAG: YdcF family protein [Candidatus Peribacteraceae bacterium]
MIPHKAHIRFLLRAAAVLGTVFCATLLVLTTYVYSQFDGTAGETPIAQCALVFGAAVRSLDEPGPGITRRTLTAVNIYQDGGVERLILSGGKGSATQESEAAVMRKVAMLAGVDPQVIRIEDTSRSTWENLQNSRPLLADCQSIVAVSDRYHLARILYLAHVQGWGDLQTYPAAAHPYWLFEFKSSLREAVAILYYATMRALMIDPIDNWLMNS